MQKFQDLLTQAAQLKQAQLKQQRKNFEALPQYLKSGLNYAKKYIQLRKQHYLIQKHISQRLKTQGNDHYLLQNYGQALSKYQQALSIFRFIHATKYQNLKDQDIIYENYTPREQNKQQHVIHLIALYLNICSALTKMNKKDEAVHAAEEAGKLDGNGSNPKIYYKKAQAYLQYINRETGDIKLGFYYLNKAYELSKDQSILNQMYKIKKQLEDQKQKEKQWFKFMFDKNKQQKNGDGMQKINSNLNYKQNNKPIQAKKTQQQQNVNINKLTTRLLTQQQNPQSHVMSQGKKSSSSQPSSLNSLNHPLPNNNPTKTNKTKQSKNHILSSDIQSFVEQVKQVSQQQTQQPITNTSSQSQNNLNTSPQQSQPQPYSYKQQQQIRKQKLQKQLQKFHQQNDLQNIKHQQYNLQHNQQSKIELQKTKLSLKPYLIIPRNDRWLIKYQQDYIHKHGSKFYSILQLYNYSDYLIEFKTLLAKCLQLKQATITPQRDQTKLLDQKIMMYDRFIEWLHKHPVQKYKRYIERYELQTKWIQANRGKPLDEVYSSGNKQTTNSSSNNSNNRNKKFVSSNNNNANITTNNSNPKFNPQARHQQLIKQARKSYEKQQQQQQQQQMLQRQQQQQQQHRRNEQRFKQQKIQHRNKDNSNPNNNPNNNQKNDNNNNNNKKQTKQLNPKTTINTYGFREQWEYDEMNEMERQRQRQKQRDLKDNVSNTNTTNQSSLPSTSTRRKYEANAEKVKKGSKVSTNSQFNDDDEVPPHLRAFLENYEDFPQSDLRVNRKHDDGDNNDDQFNSNNIKDNIKDRSNNRNQTKYTTNSTPNSKPTSSSTYKSSSKSSSSPSYNYRQQCQQPQNQQQAYEHEQLQQNRSPFTFVNTLVVIIVVTLLAKLVF